MTERRTSPQNSKEVRQTKKCFKKSAQKENDHCTEELSPYLEELKKSKVKRMEKLADVSSRVPADIKEHEVIMSWLLQRGDIIKKQAEGLKEWEKVDVKVGARRRKIVDPDILQGTF